MTDGDILHILHYSPMAWNLTGAIATGFNIVPANTTHGAIDWADILDGYLHISYTAVGSGNFYLPSSFI